MNDHKIGFINWDWPNRSCEGCKHLENGQCANMPVGSELSYDEEGVYCNIYEGQNRNEVTQKTQTLDKNLDINEGQQ